MQNVYLNPLIGTFHYGICVISHLIFPTMLVFISGAKSKNNLRGHVAF